MDDLPALRRAEQHEEPLVREHATWAIGQIEKRSGCSVETIIFQQENMKS